MFYPTASTAEIFAAAIRERDYRRRLADLRPDGGFDIADVCEAVTGADTTARSPEPRDFLDTLTAWSQRRDIDDRIARLHASARPATPPADAGDLERQIRRARAELAESRGGRTFTPRGLSPALGLTPFDFEAAQRDNPERLRTAAHEAGHAVAALSRGRTPKSGVTRLDDSGEVIFTEAVDAASAAAGLEAELLFDLANGYTWTYWNSTAPASDRQVFERATARDGEAQNKALRAARTLIETNAAAVRGLTVLFYENAGVTIDGRYLESVYRWHNDPNYLADERADLDHAKQAAAARLRDAERV